MSFIYPLTRQVSDGAGSAQPLTLHDRIQGNLTDEDRLVLQDDFSGIERMSDNDTGTNLLGPITVIDTLLNDMMLLIAY